MRVFPYIINLYYKPAYPMRMKGLGSREVQGNPGVKQREDCAQQ